MSQYVCLMLFVGQFKEFYRISRVNIRLEHEYGNGRQKLLLKYVFLKKVWYEALI
jgi:hypothetical protein